MAQTLKELALKYLRDKIADGTYPPGGKLSDLAISKEIGGISRTPIREAINQLSAEGVIEMRAHEGAFVKVPSKNTISELYELREILESHCAKKVSANPSPKLLKSLKQCFSKIGDLKKGIKAKDEYLSEESTSKQRAYDLEFHQLIIKAAENQSLEKIIEDSRILTHVFNLMEKRMPVKELNETYEFHKKLLDAVSRKNPQEAEKRMREHIRDGLSRALSRESEKPLKKGRQIPESLQKYLSD